jgi:hypothetical protein
MNIYIACSLTHVPREHFSKYVNFIHKLATEIKADNTKYALINSDPQLDRIPNEEKAKYCYLWDRKMVEEADLIIAEASFPSTGLGIELQIAENKNIPIIIVFSDYDKNKAQPISYTNPNNQEYDLQIGEGFVSLMALGLPNIFKVIKYHNKNECINDINCEIEKIQSNNILS